MASSVTVAIKVKTHILYKYFTMYFFSSVVEYYTKVINY